MLKHFFGTAFAAVPNRDVQSAQQLNDYLARNNYDEISTVDIATLEPLLTVGSTPAPRPRGQCFDFRDGKCKRGTSCRFRHDNKRKQQEAFGRVCKYFAKGDCNKKRCRFRHVTFENKLKNKHVARLERQLAILSKRVNAAVKVEVNGLHRDMEEDDDSEAYETSCNQLPMVRRSA